MEALNALDPAQATFLDVTKVKTLLDLTKIAAVDSEFEVARNSLGTQMKESSPPDEAKWTTKQVIKARQKFSIVFIIFKNLKKLQGSF